MTDQTKIIFLTPTLLNARMRDYLSRQVRRAIEKGKLIIATDDPNGGDVTVRQVVSEMMYEGMLLTDIAGEKRHLMPKPISKHTVENYEFLLIDATMMSDEIVLLYNGSVYSEFVKQVAEYAIGVGRKVFAVDFDKETLVVEIHEK